MAVVRALEVLPGEIEIRTDSMYVINIVTMWGARWRSNGWTRPNGTVLNLDIIRPLLDKIDQRPGPITWTHVKSHNGEPGNEAADKLAQQGARLDLLV